MRRLQIKFPNQIRISGWDFGSSARAMNQAGGYISTQADLRTVRKSTTERKSMSTKTSIKRIALVAVSALGLGVVTSIAPASAEATTSEIAGISATTNGLRAGITTAVYLKALPNADTDNSEAVTLNSVITLRPAGSAVTLNDTTTVTQSGSSVTVTGAGITGVSSTVEHKFTPDIAGTYTMVVWHDANTDSVRDAGEKSLTLTLVVVPQTDAITATVSVVNSTASMDTTFGAAATVTIKNSNGVPTRLATFEQLSVSASNSGVVSVGSDSAGTQTPASSISGVTALTQSKFTKGVAYLNVTKTAAGTSVLSVTGEAGAASSGINTSNTLTFKDTSACDATDSATSGTLSVDNTTGTSASSTTLNVKKSTSTAVSFVATLKSTDTDYVADSYCDVLVADTSGYHLGAAAFKYNLATLADGAELAFSVSVNLPLSAAVKVTLVNGDGTDTYWDITGATAESTTLANTSDYYRALSGATVALTALVKDQFGVAMADQAVTVTVSGRNSKSATVMTNSSGYASYTFTDTVGATSTVSSDTIVLDGPGSGDSDTVTITYAATIGVSTITLTGGNVSAGVTATTATTKDINAGASGAQATTHSYAAVVKDANGAVLVGVPVVWTVSGTGAAIPSTKQTVYTDSTGTSTSAVYGWVAGTYTVTATADGKTASGTITFGQTGAGEERTISVAASGPVVTATVKDRFGNGVPSVTVYATKTGDGYFGSGVTKTSGTTDSNGQVEFVVSGGAATVTVSTISYSAVAGTKGSGQTSALKGYADANADPADDTAFTASAAGTTTTAETGVGASFDAAGVSSASVDVTLAGSTDAIDAANEATDAANAATDAANAAAEAADAATAAAQDAQAAVAELATKVASLIAGIKAQITTLTNLVIKIQKKVRA
jgi:trimeric autotransporter adhesin